ncbi:MAG TPA: nuclear transport factor 2 family protein [Sphingobacteriaceae bacterium]
MKTLKIQIATALLIVFSTTAFASDIEKNERIKVNHTLQKYIDALSYGKINGIADVFDSQAKFTITGGKKTINYNKAQMLNSLHVMKNIEQNCTTSFSFIELNAAQVIVKVTMKYEGFSRVNFLNMANTADGWKITNVSSSFI